MVVTLPSWTETGVSVIDACQGDPAIANRIVCRELMAETKTFYDNLARAGLFQRVNSGHPQFIFRMANVNTKRSSAVDRLYDNWIVYILPRI